MPGLLLTAWGRCVGIDAPPEVLALLRERLPFGARLVSGRRPERTWRVTGGAGGFEVAHDEGAVVTGALPDPVTAAEALLSDLELWLAEHARRHVFVHAGCVAVAGRALLLPGRTLAGKSTLTAALVRAGATYWSDEYAVLRPDGRVQPYARPLAIRPRSGEAPGPSRRVPATELGGRVGSGSAEVTLVALLQHDSGAGWAVQPSSPGQVALAMLENTVPARTRPRAVLAAVTAAASGAAGVRGTRGEAEEAAPLLLALLSPPPTKNPAGKGPRGSK